MDIIIIITIAITAIISYLGFQNQLLFEKYKFNVSSILYKKEYIRLLSSGFLHADLMHLILNMYVLNMFAPTILENFGYFGFILIYLGSILGGNLFSLFIYKNQGWYSAIGASGGVSGIIFAGVALSPKLVNIGIIFLPREWSIPGYVFGLLYFGYSVYMMLNPKQNDNIGHASHLGGAIFGLIYVLVANPIESMRNSFYLVIMALPLFYMAYAVFVQKKIG